MKFLITGAAGFIGFHVAQRLCTLQHEVVGIDNLNDYYEIGLKESRLERLRLFENFTWNKLDICDQQGMDQLFKSHQFERVIHLAAQAGVRYSVENPLAYAQSNLMGYFVVLDCCRKNQIQHLVYASSSSVYGLNNKIPFSTSDPVEQPVSFYAATKKSNELMAHSYSHIYGLPTTGLRFFSVYGPWGRPDMAYFKFTRAMLNGEAIDVYNQGNLSRDFTYIDDIVNGIVHIQNIIPTKSENPLADTNNQSSIPYRIFNIGRGEPIKLMEFISAIEKSLGIKAHKNFIEMQNGDLYRTYADVEEFKNVTGVVAETPLQQGIDNFVKWYKSYYQ